MTPLALFAEAPISTGTFVVDVFLGILGVIGVVGIIGGASAYFYKGRADALISLQEKEINVLKDNNKQLKENNQTLMDLNDTLVRERQEFLAEQKRMKKEIATLRSVITQPKYLNELAGKLAAQHQEVIDKLTDIAEGIVNPPEANSTTKKA